MTDSTATTATTKANEPFTVEDTEKWIDMVNDLESKREDVWRQLFSKHGFNIDAGDTCVAHPSIIDKLSNTIPNRFKYQIQKSDLAPHGSLFFIKASS